MRVFSREDHITASFRVRQHTAVCNVRMMGPKFGLASEFGRQITIGQRSDSLPRRYECGQDHHQGYPGIGHGGVIMSLMYEIMANIRRYSGQHGNKTIRISEKFHSRREHPRQLECQALAKEI